MSQKGVVCLSEVSTLGLSLVHGSRSECGVSLSSIKYNSNQGDRGSAVVKVLCYKSEGRWFDPSWCQWIFH